MIAADRVMMGDGATRRDQRLARGVLDRAPLCQQIPVSSESMECEIGCRPVGVDMSESAGDLSRPTSDVANRRLGRRFYLVVKILEPIPGDRSLEGVDDDRPLNEALAGIRHPDEGVAPQSG